MPQFDTVTFFNQIFWFFSVFLSFYFIILKGLLPVVTTSLKTRKKLVHSLIFFGEFGGIVSAEVKKFYTKRILKIVKII
jgi:hypothetical protein